MEETKMQTPAFKWEWNINTALLLTVAAGLLGAGYFINDVVRVSEDHGRNIARIDMRVDRISEEMRSIPNHELRLLTAEKAIAEGIGDMRNIEETSNELKSDVRVIREIVERIEGAQTRSAPVR